MKKATPLALATATVVSALFVLSSSNVNAATLIAQWDLNEGSGTTITSQFPTGPGVVSENFPIISEYTKDDPPVQIDTPAITWGGSGVGAASSTNFLEFNGTNPINTLNTNVSGAGLATTPSQSTFVAWINPTGAGGIISYSPKGGLGLLKGTDLRFLVDSSGNLRGEVTGGSFVSKDHNFINDGWNMVAIVFDGNANTSKLYQGGVGFLSIGASSNQAIATASNTTGGSGASLINIVLGNIQNGSYSFKGGIDMVKVYDGALTLGELNALYTVIPEPASVALIFGGLFMTFAVLRRKRQIV